MLGTHVKRLACCALAIILAACGTPKVGPGYYRVERGDTLSQIARKQRQSVQSIVRWNALSNPDAIEAGQVLRVTPPANTASASNSGTAARSASNTGSAKIAGKTRSAPARSTPAPVDTPPPATSIALVWPAAGSVVRNFDGKNSKGIDIANSAGTPVNAAASGTVVYAGNGLRGYGNLLIVKHNAQYLTAYAHNRTLLVKEGQAVTQGQKIAEMGNTDADRVMLHFELRYLGKSIDPSRALPAR
ncbi:peptidoglycan DD-metalloendopeptidase family protein [Paraburkholderia bonniea]|uniref:peptidoglycan DD-metalloendopeptidase family protein n=1 Tax=Paraburkholderia bonniea TaxID=2152891 RepID=UPI0012914E65|nr:peptidoglycan DD-metalloendopeptidase family protein [Paraburkholderia bonniea]WJF91058.1 peptidoglycan DD-metalloendopeptidase family protein [Paraburkholderia bonniea]WJF94372.1 peptidoglycan DD-metalloendopeptidase family protein [Paraburkholderia bonniea]